MAFAKLPRGANDHLPACCDRTKTPVVGYMVGRSPWGLSTLRGQRYRSGSVPLVKFFTNSACSSHDT